MQQRVLPFSLFESIRNDVLGTELYTIDVSDWSKENVQPGYEYGDPNHIKTVVTVFKLEELSQLNKDLHDLNLMRSQLETDVEEYVGELDALREVHQSFYTGPIKLRGVYFEIEGPSKAVINYEIYFGVSDASEESVKAFFCSTLGDTILFNT